jgi:hypothetical protein
MRDAQIQHLLEQLNESIDLCERLWGLMLLGEANREAPAQAECSPYLRRGFLRQPALIITPRGFTPV